MDSYNRKINYYETDRMGITHHSNYVRFMEEARVDFFEKIGWSYAKFEELGVASPVVNISCDFKKSTTFGDEISIKVKVQKVSVCKIVLEYECETTSEKGIVFTATSSHCFIENDGKPVVLSKKFPDFYEKLLQLHN